MIFMKTTTTKIQISKGMEFLKRFGKSFIQSRNNKGPILDPCGIPGFIYVLEEHVLPTLQT